MGYKARKQIYPSLPRRRGILDGWRVEWWILVTPAAAMCRLDRTARRSLEANPALHLTSCSSFPGPSLHALVLHFFFIWQHLYFTTLFLSPNFDRFDNALQPCILVNSVSLVSRAFLFWSPFPWILFCATGRDGAAPPRWLLWCGLRVRLFRTPCKATPGHHTL